MPLDDKSIDYEVGAEIISEAINKEAQELNKAEDEDQRQKHKDEIKNLKQQRLEILKGNKKLLRRLFKIYAKEMKKDNINRL